MTVDVIITSKHALSTKNTKLNDLSQQFFFLIYNSFKRFDFVGINAN